MHFKREIYYYKNYFKEFYWKQDLPTRKKIDWTIGLLRDLEVIPSKFFKNIKGSDGIDEIRIMMSRNIFRIFCFFDEKNTIIVLHGYQKKTQKTPKREIARAERLKREYHERKS
ncbi:MAG TPA: type II toxin-antitoxin system RelE/ParE family toxin [Bacteroidaceae bacterium]|nr:type II toxin-antitoxin system RelE/ParE family toxin [Bacteroidaceae bacterium]